MCARHRSRLQGPSDEQDAVFALVGARISVIETDNMEVCVGV